MSRLDQRGHIRIIWPSIGEDEWDERWSAVRDTVKAIVPGWHRYLSSRSFMILPGTENVAEELSCEIARIDAGFEVSWEVE